jgi:hypothetical protein
MAIQPTFKKYWRVRQESSFNAASPAAGSEWNLGLGGANGWMDLPVVKGSDGLQPKTIPIYPGVASGKRSMNNALPIAGADDPALGSLEMVFYPELIDRILLATFGTVTRTPTAGSAALASTAFASLATLDTQPNGTEQLKFTIASSTAANGAEIEIIQDGVTVETIVIGTSASSVNGDYYSKGAYDGSTNAITFSVNGTVTSGMVTVSGIDYTTNEFKPSTTTNPSLVIQQNGRVEAGSGNSEYFPGCVVQSAVMAYDRNAPDNVLMFNPTIQGIRPTNATALAYNDDASAYYRPIAGWTGSVQVDDVANTEFVSASFNITPNNVHLMTSSGNQWATQKIEGEFEVTGEFVVLPGDSSYWDAYRNQTVDKLEFEFLTPFYVVDTTPYQVKVQMSQVSFEDYTRNTQNFALGVSLPFRAIYSTDDAAAIVLTTRCRMPV